MVVVDGAGQDMPRSATGVIPPPARHSECRIGVDPSQLTDEGIEAGVHPTRIDPPAALKELHVDDLQSGALLERIVLDEATHDVRFCEQGDSGKRRCTGDALLEARVGHTSRSTFRPATQGIPSQNQSDTGTGTHDAGADDNWGIRHAVQLVGDTDRSSGQ